MWDRRFESGFLQRGVHCEPTIGRTQEKAKSDALATRAASEGACDAVDHAKIALSTAGAAAKLATAIVDPPPITPASASTTQAAASSNPHRRQAVARPPRV